MRKGRATVERGSWSDRRARRTPGRQQRARKLEDLYGAAHVAEVWEAESWTRWWMRGLLQLMRTHGQRG